MRHGAMTHFVIGALIGLTITAAVFVAWPTLYSTSRWRGYERTSATRPHEYNSSPLARKHVLVAFSVTGLLFGAVASGMRGVVVAWLGLVAALLISFALRPAAWSSNLAPLAVIVYPVQASLFLIAGAASCAVVHGVRRLRS